MHMFFLFVCEYVCVLISPSSYNLLATYLFIHVFIENERRLAILFLSVCRSFDA